MNYLVFCVTVILGFGIVETGHADENTDQQSGQYSVLLGGAAFVSPDYQGSDDYKLGAMPFLSLSWQSAPVVPTDGTGLQLGMHDITLEVPGSLDVGIAKLYRAEGIYRANVGLSYNGGRKQSANVALNGMGTIKGHTTADVGINFEAKDSGWKYGLALQSALGSDDRGTLINGQIGYALKLSEKISLTPSVRTSWADSKHMQSYFGVNTTQAGASSYSQFDANAGIKSVGVGAELGWMISEHWMANGSLGLTKLTGDAADSPLVKNAGSSNQFMVMGGLIYKF